MRGRTVDNCAVSDDECAECRHGQDVPWDDFQCAAGTGDGVLRCLYIFRDEMRWVDG